MEMLFRCLSNAKIEVCEGNKFQRVSSFVITVNMIFFSGECSYSNAFFPPLSKQMIRLQARF